MNSTAIQNNSADIISDNAEKNQGVNENIITSAIEKIVRQGKTASGQNVPAVAIYHHLIDKCGDNEDFAELVMAEEKSVSGCYSHVSQRAYEMAAMQNITADNGGNNSYIGIGLDDSAIFGLADEYFTLSDDEIEERRESERKDREEARKAADEAREAARKKKAEEETKAKKEKAAKKEEAEKRKAEAKAAEEAQMSLLD